MANLNHYAISRILGSTIQEYSRRGFGGMQVAASAGEMLCTRPKVSKSLPSDKHRDRTIVEAFTEIYKGLSVDRVLSDPAHAATFISSCRRRGLVDPVALLNRRLLRIRKATDLSVRLPKADSKVAERRDYHSLLVAAEIAFAQTYYRHGSTVDDMLADPEIGEYYDSVAANITPGYAPVDYRQAALYLRKNIRARSKSEKVQLSQIESNVFDCRWLKLGTLEGKLSRTSESEGILQLKEPKRSLYISRVQSISQAVATVQSPEFLKGIANRFWDPNPSNISVRALYPGQDQYSLRILELKAIEVYRPIFNAPIAA